ncbi:MAG TPA: hypothetical protein VKS82_22250 [Streptosporangiaceae bacterium]|nr:hypothetical protein [Streptosporangiaceae bacterium]
MPEAETARLWDGGPAQQQRRQLLPPHRSSATIPQIIYTQPLPGIAVCGILWRVGMCHPRGGTPARIALGRRSAVGQECGEPSVLAMKAPGTVIKISSAWVMHTHAEWPAGSARLISARCEHDFPVRLISQ